MDVIDLLNEVIAEKEGLVENAPYGIGGSPFAMRKSLFGEVKSGAGRRVGRHQFTSDAEIEDLQARRADDKNRSNRRRVLKTDEPARASQKRSNQKEIARTNRWARNTDSGEESKETAPYKNHERKIPRNDGKALPNADEKGIQKRGRVARAVMRAAITKIRHHGEERSHLRATNPHYASIEHDKDEGVRGDLHEEYGHRGGIRPEHVEAAKDKTEVADRRYRQASRASSGRAFDNYRGAVSGRGARQEHVRNTVNNPLDSTRKNRRERVGRQQSDTVGQQNPVYHPPKQKSLPYGIKSSPFANRKALSAYNLGTGGALVPDATFPKKKVGEKGEKKLRRHLRRDASARRKLDQHDAGAVKENMERYKKDPYYREAVHAASGHHVHDGYNVTNDEASEMEQGRRAVHDMKEESFRHPPSARHDLAEKRRRANTRAEHAVVTSVRREQSRPYEPTPTPPNPRFRKKSLDSIREAYKSGD